MSDAVSTIEDPDRMRQAGRELLSLAFIDARNRTLRWLSAFAGFDASAAAAEFDPPQWLVGHAAWQQEYTIGRNVRRSRGDGGAARGVRLASIEPRADAWFDPRATTRDQRWQDTDVGDAHLRDYLAATLDATLELLERVDDTDAALQPYRQALAVEDATAETLAEMAQAAALPGARTTGLWPTWPSRVRRDALWFPAQHWMLGSPPSGCVPLEEQWAHDVAVPEFEIDAQPVQWAQFVEFAEDGGYDDPQWWSTEGWRWAETLHRRAPRYVEQLQRGVLLQRQGQVQRAAAPQAVMHLSWHEAQAWCRWAGRRLPTEPEWELAACTAAPRGFVWGDVWEWTASRAVSWSDAPPDPSAAGARVARGGSRLTVPRLRHPKLRRFLAPSADAAFVGFRSCAL
ncbi:MAG: SUMF1/EgtB/PvdO family nonheme iron enzyme [Burkholderiaceae bacterium]|nr:SUMF1/EgtB/PvdO family nonheme iron enzyme [Burkholderiaceae bacterium]